MKKIIYSLMTMGLLMTGCADFDDPVTEKYGDAPSVAIEVTETTDSTFTFTVTPSEGTMFYSVLVDEADAPVALNAESLYKGLYSSTYGTIVVDAKEQATFTYNMRNAEGAPIASPNTTYQIYAVAANEKSVIGEIAVESVTTTDALAPKPVDYEYDPDNGVMYVAFSEAITRVEDVAVTAKYYKIMELYNGVVAPVDVDADSIVVEVQDNQIAILTKSAPAGAYVSFSWEEGAFVDSYGHKCAAITSGFSESEGDFVGLSGQNTNVPFAISEENVTAPELGSAFNKWADFMGVLTMNGAVYYPVDEDGNVIRKEVVVTYVNAQSETSIKLSSSQWMTTRNNFAFVLPQAPAYGDYVGIKIPAGAFVDAYGNPNEEIEFAEAWLYSYGFTRENFLGDYTMQWKSYFDNSVYAENISITADPESETGVVISNLFAEGTSIKGICNGDYGTIAIPIDQSLGKYEFRIDAQGNTTIAEVFFSNGGSDDDIILQFSADGSFSSPTLWGYYIDGLGWYDAAAETYGTKAVAATSLSRSAKMFSINNVSVLSPKSIK
ncbi:MAG: hypothetical protein IJN66_00545 [Muribaculaceae bacterium]|nr:hypothetical protein [Muribaculaceae bacterium]